MCAQRQLTDLEEPSLIGTNNSSQLSPCCAHAQRLGNVFIQIQMLVSRYLTRFILGFNLQVAKVLTVLLTVTEIEASSRNKMPWYAGPHVFLILTVRLSQCKCLLVQLNYMYCFFIEGTCLKFCSINVIHLRFMKFLMVGDYVAIFAKLYKDQRIKSDLFVFKGSV